MVPGGRRLTEGVQSSTARTAVNELLARGRHRLGGHARHVDTRRHLELVALQGGQKIHKLVITQDYHKTTRMAGTDVLTLHAQAPFCYKHDKYGHTKINDTSG